MTKIITLVLGLMLTAASCNLFGASGVKGILKSEDGGDTYKAANVMDPKGDIDGISVNSLVMNPNDSDILYLGSGQGIHRSDDGAGKWKHVLTGMRVGDISVDPSKDTILYAAGITGENGRVLKSTDSGESWKEIYTEPSKSNPVLSVAISPANARIVVIGLQSGELIRSTDEGATWQLIRDFSNPIIDIEYVDPTTAYILTQSSGLYVSSDQGSNWLPVNVVIQAQADDGLAYTKNTAARTFYKAAYDKRLKGVIFLASASGLVRTVDGGVTWNLMTLPVTNQTLQVSSVAINPTDSNTLYIAVGATMFKSTNGGVTWETKKLPTSQRIKHILINPDEPNKIYLGAGDK